MRTVEISLKNGKTYRGMCNGKIYNNASLIKQFCSIKLHFIDYQSVLFDKTGGNNQPFFLILSNKNKQRTDIKTLLFDKTRGNPEPFFTILKNKPI